MPPRPPFLRALFLSFFCVACNLENLGDEPPRATIYFPNAIALSPHGPEQPARYLYVVNSNFDLRYNAGTLQAYSLDKLEAAIAAKGFDGVIEAADAFEDEEHIPSFSVGVGSNASGRRLVVATRTADAPTYVSVDPGASGERVLRCEGGCGIDAEHTYTDRYEDKQVDWPDEPVAVIAGQLDDWFVSAPPLAAGESAFAEDEDEYALIAHRDGELSLFVERGGNSLAMTALLQGAVGGPTDLAYDASTKLVFATTFVPGQGPRVLGRFGISIPGDDDGDPIPRQANVFDAGGAVIEPFDANRNTRSIAFLPALAAAGALFATPSALIVAQQPSALILADVGRDQAPTASGVPRARVKGSVSLGFGASRVAAGMVKEIPVAVVASFDSRELALVDLRTMVVRSVVPNLSGPYSVALDEARGLAFVTDFRSSVVRVLDVKPALESDGSEPLEVVATLGRPRVLQELR